MCQGKLWELFLPWIPGLADSKCCFPGTNNIADYLRLIRPCLKLFRSVYVCCVKCCAVFCRHWNFSRRHAENNWRMFRVYPA